MQMTMRPMTSTILAICILVVVESLAFLLWASFHLGLELPLGFIVLTEPRIIPAFVVETLCGVGLAVSAYALFTHKQWAWRALFSAHIFAISGVLLGMTAITMGRGPRTVSNDLYHIVIMVLLITNLMLVQRAGAKMALARLSNTPS